MSTTLEVFAEITCPFAYVGLQHIVEHVEAGDHPTDIVVRAWPLEWVNGAGLAVDGVIEKSAALCEQLDIDAFAGLDADQWPTTTVPAHRLTIAAYDVDAPTGLAVSLAIRHALFEEGRDISDPDVLDAIASAHGLSVDDAADEAAVRAEYDLGVERGVKGSPHFWLGDDGFFCPALDLGRDDDNHLIARFDPEALTAFYSRLDR
jgi:predicted DsbA family dithiol-disulfide isomerase